MGSAYSDLQRPPLREAALRRALLVPGGLWSSVRVVAQTGSTNADLLAAARSGAPEGQVLVAERQVNGRGRLDRTWQCPPRAGITVSVLLRPDEPAVGWPPAPANRFGWLPLLAGVAVVQAVRRVAAVDAALKWPNDLLVDGRKCGGILAEVAPGPEGSAVALGIGLNVSLTADELPHRQATSLLLADAVATDRDPLLRALLRDLADRYVRWRATGGDPDSSGLRRAYEEHCATLGLPVQVALPGEQNLVGTAEAVDVDGRLRVRGPDGRVHALAAGDVVHLRPSGWVDPHAVASTQ